MVFLGAQGDHRLKSNHAISFRTIGAHEMISFGTTNSNRVGVGTASHKKKEHPARLLPRSAIGMEELVPVRWVLAQGKGREGKGREGKGRGGEGRGGEGKGGEGREGKGKAREGRTPTTRTLQPRSLSS